MNTESALDIDWFALDIRGNIVHFASGGGKLPTIVREMDNELLRSFFHQLPKKSLNVDYSIGLSTFVSLNGDELEAYVQDFKQMSERGLYSFDKSNLGNFSDNKYHLVCGPQNKILIDELPIQIKDQLVKLKFNFLAEELIQVDISDYV